MACAVECGWLAGGNVLGVREQQVGVELEGDLRGVIFRVEGLFGLGFGDGGLELVEPGSGGGERAVSDGAGVGVDLRGDRGEEAAAGKDAAFEVGKECFAECAEASDPGGRRACGVDDLGLEDRVGGLDGRELQFLLGAEVREEAALAHPDRVRESSEREPFDALDRRQLRCLAQDRLAAADAVAPLPRGGGGSPGVVGRPSLDKLARSVVLLRHDRPVVLIEEDGNDYDHDRPTGAVKQRQQATWASGDYSAVATLIVPVAERLVDLADLRAGSRVLDVATGSANAAIAAARLQTDVVGIDYVEALLDRGRERAAAEGLEIDLRAGDAEDAALPRLLVRRGHLGVRLDVRAQPRADRRRDRPRHPARRDDRARKLDTGRLPRRPVSRVAQFAPPPAGVASPMLWGSADHIGSLFGPDVHWTHTTETFTFRFPTAEAFVDYFAEHYGPTLKAIAAAGGRAEELKSALTELVRAWNRLDQQAPSRSRRRTWPPSATECRPSRPPEDRDDSLGDRPRCSADARLL